MIVIITKDTVKQECIESVQEQGCPWIIRGERPSFFHENRIIQTYVNCSKNREEARKIALASNFSHYLFIDSDIVLPKNAFKTFMIQDKDVQGGWYRMRGRSTQWVCGNWVADNIFINKKFPENSLVRVDMVGLGCAFIKREVLEKTQFEPGIDTFAKNEHGETILCGECIAFGNKVFDLGFNMYMNGDIICTHLE